MSRGGARPGPRTRVIHQETQQERPAIDWAISLPDARGFVAAGLSAEEAVQLCESDAVGPPVSGIKRLCVFISFQRRMRALNSFRGFKYR